MSYYIYPIGFVVTVIIYYLFLRILLISTHYYLKKKYLINLSVKSIRFNSLKTINISSPRLGISIKIEHFGLSSKLFNSKYNSLFVLKFSDIRLEGDIAAAFNCLSRSKNATESSPSVDHKSLFRKILDYFIISKIILILKRIVFTISNYFLSNLQISLQNTSLMQLCLHSKNSIFNDCLMHSTIQLIQFEFVTQLKRQITFQVEGFSIKILKFNNQNERDGKTCIAQMSFPFRFNYIIDDKSVDILISDLEIIIYEILQLVNMFSRKSQTCQTEIKVPQYKLFEEFMLVFHKILNKNLIRNITFRLNSSSIKLVREFGKKELMFCVKPIEFTLNKLDCTRLESHLMISNLGIQDSESIIDFSLNKCSVICKIEKEKLYEKLHVHLLLEISAYSFVINNMMINSWFQYFVNVIHNIKSYQNANNSNKSPSSEKLMPINEVASKYINKFVFVMDINDASLSIMKQSKENLMVTYGLKHLKTSCVRNLDVYFKETSVELLMETFWCWNGNKNLKPYNPNSLKKYHEKHVPLFMSTLLLKFGNMNSSDLRITCVMDGLQISVEHFLNQLENIDFQFFQSYSSVQSSPPIIESNISGYNLLAQINFTSVNLFTSQLMVRIDSMASDLNGSKSTCSINGFAVNSMYAPSPTLACLKASELVKCRIVYFSVVRINFSQDIKEISLTLTEEIFAQWSPLFYLNVLDLYEDFYRIYLNFLSIKPYSDNSLKAYGNLKGFNLNLKLDGKISLGMLLSNEDDTIRFETEYLLIIFYNMKYFSSKCEQLSIYFNEVLNCNVEHFNVKYSDEKSKNSFLERKSFKLTEKEKNDSIEVIIEKVSLYFPYKFNFSYYFNEKFISIIKWLRLFRSKEKIPKWMQNDPNVPLAPDFLIKIQAILIELSDDPFEVRLGDNYELLDDEYNESLKRWNMLMEKIDEKRRKNIIISDSKIDELKKAFDKQNAKTYLERSRKMYESSEMRTQLFSIKAENFQIQLISDTSYNTYDKMVNILKSIDCYSPFPDDLKFSTIWCKQVFCNIGLFLITLRDFPQPMLNAKKIYFRGILMGAEQEASPRAKRTCEIDMGPNFSKINVERSMTTLKFYHDLTSNITSLIYTHGACWEPILQQVSLSFEFIFRPSSDPSPTLTWWDKMRFLFHGNLSVQSKRISIVFHASLDPYNSTELIEISFIDASIQFVTGKISVLSDLDVFVHTASKYDECRIIHLPYITVTFNLNWECHGNKNDHHSVMPCARDKLPEYTCNQVHDSYRAFRSHHLNLSASIETKEHINSDIEGPIPSILLYNSTLRWLENKMFMITGFPRLTRRGKLFGNVKPRKTPFTRLFKAIRLTIYLQKFEITYWSSFNRSRGFKITSSNLTHSGEHRQTFVKINDNLIHRPRPLWALVYMNSELSNVEIELHKDSDNETEPEKVKANPIWNFFLNIHKVSYNRETKLPHIFTEDQEPEQSPIHRLIVHDLKGAWTKDNRDIVLSLFDSYFKTQLLKRNLSTEALRLFKDQINGSPSKNSISQPTSEQNPYILSKGNAANMLQKLISEVETSSNIVDTEQIENGVNDIVPLYGVEACQSNDIILNNWLIELINSQVVLRGCETDGYVIMSAAKTQVTQRIHRPVWKNRILYSKTTWQGSLECMQYYATVDAGGLRIDDITWLDLDDIEERNCKEIVEIPDLVGSGRSVGGVVNSEAGGSSCNSSNEVNKVPIQLQRIVSRCRCEFFYASYGENADPNNYDEVPPLPQDDDLLPLEPWDKEIAVDTFTLTHEHLEISTNSQQFAMIMDLVNNLLLYVESHKKEVYEKQQRIRFSMQLNSMEDQREPISELQDKVRSLLNKIKMYQQESYLLRKRNSSLQDDSIQSENDAILDKLKKCKEELNVVSEDLSIMINCYKEAQLIASKTKERQVAAQESRGPLMAQVIRRNEVCFKQASWRLTDADGQLGLADLVLNNFLYTKVSKNDDSVEHSFVLGYIHVQNMLPNQAYRDVLQPTELQPNMPVDQHRALRIFCIERAPVGGISVKEHLEVNVIPITLGITYAFFSKMLKFFFPERGTDSTSIISETNTNSETLDEFSSHTTKGKKKNVIKREESATNLSNSISSSYNFKSNSKNSLQMAKDIHHIEKMRERASKNQTFVYIKIPEVPIKISYKGYKNKNLEDLHDVNLLLPTIEYHNRTWTWLDLLMALKSDSKRVLVSQALKHKFHLSKHKSLSNESDNKKTNPTNQPQSTEDEDKVRILLGNIVVPQKSTKTKSILLFGNKK